MKKQEREVKKVGKPSLFDDPKVMQIEIDKYFASTEEPTVTGLAYYLGFASRQSFYDYENKELFAYTIKKARLRIEAKYESITVYSKQPTGAIFALKNFGWSDKQQIEHSGELTGFTIEVVDQKTK